MERNPENKMGEEIIAALSAANNYLPDTLSNENVQPPSAISYGAEGVTTFSGYPRDNGGEKVWQWLEERQVYYFSSSERELDVNDAGASEDRGGESPETPRP